MTWSHYQHERTQARRAPIAVTATGGVEMLFECDMRAGNLSGNLDGRYTVKPVLRDCIGPPL